MPRVIVPVTSLTPPKATLTTAIAGANNDLIFTAKVGGPGGNAIRITYVVAGNNTPLTIVVQGYDITVNVATSGAGAATSTSALVKAALEVSADAIKLITVAHATPDDGTGIVAALAFTALAGGNLSTAQPAETNGDAANGHYFAGNDGLTVLEVVSSDAAARTVSVEYSPYYTPLADVAAEVVSIPAATKASHTTALAGANNDLVFTADAVGPHGNSIRIAYIVSGLSTPLTISVTGMDITVNVATDGAGAATSTANAVKTALDANASAAALIDTALASGNDGTGIVAAFAMTNLAGGATTVQRLGPFSNIAFDQNVAREVYFTPSVSNTVDFRVYRVVRAE